MTCTPSAPHLRRLMRCNLTIARVVLGTLGALGACAPAERPGIAPQHVWLLTFDNLRAERLSAYMYNRDTTFEPTDSQLRQQGITTCLDELIAEGVLFAEAFAPSGRRLPSLASLMTGCAPSENGCVGESDALDTEIPTMAERFASAGFETVAFVSRAADLSPLRRGFKEFTASDVAVSVLEPDTATLAAALNWIGDHDFGTGRPVFLWMHLSSLGPPIEPEGIIGAQSADVFVERYADLEYHGPASEGPAFQLAAHAGDVLVAPADRKHVGDLYDSELRRLHVLLRRFLDYAHYATQTAGALDHTLLVIAGTTGIELGERHGYFGSAKSLHESALRIPLALRHVDSLTGSRILNEVVELRDVAPTLYDWFDLDESGTSGRSLLPCIDSYVERPFETRPAVAVSPEGIFSVRDPEFRLIWNPDAAEPGSAAAGAGESGNKESSKAASGNYPVPEVQLFASPHDRWEQADLAAEYPEVVERLKRVAREWTRTSKPGERE